MVKWVEIKIATAGCSEFCSWYCKAYFGNYRCAYVYIVMAWVSWHGDRINTKTGFDQVLGSSFLTVKEKFIMCMCYSNFRNSFCVYIIHQLLFDRHFQFNRVSCIRCQRVDKQLTSKILILDIFVFSSRKIRVIWKSYQQQIDTHPLLNGYVSQFWQA